MKKGFTLLETLVTVMIFSFIVIGIYGVLGVAQTNYDTRSVSLNLQRQARQGINWLSREMRQAYWSSISIASPDSNNNNSITFNTPDATGVNYSVTKTQGLGSTLWQLERTCPACASKIRANDIIGLNLSQGSGHILNIQMTTSKTFSSRGKAWTLTFPLSEQVEVRNP